MGASGSVNVPRMLRPCIGIWGTPSTTAGGSIPSTSRTVGVMSMASTNCVRIAPRSRITAGQVTISGSRTPPPYGVDLYFWNGVAPSQAQGRWYIGSDVREPTSSSRASSCPTSAARWYLTRNCPVGPPSGVAPLSEMRKISVSS